MQSNVHVLNGTGSIPKERESLLEGTGPKTCLTRLACLLVLSPLPLLTLPLRSIQSTLESFVFNFSADAIFNEIRSERLFEQSGCDFTCAVAGSNLPNAEPAESVCDIL